MGDGSASNIPPLSDAYHRARRQYGLFSGLLIAWELIGIELQPEISSYLNIRLRSADAAPFVLLALIVYFALRITIEWRQCDRGRRNLMASRIDVRVAHGLGVIAIAIYLFQRALDVQLFQLWKHDLGLTLSTATVFSGFFMGAALMLKVYMDYSVTEFRKELKEHRVIWSGAQRF